MAKIKEFQIIGLFNQFDVCLPIKEDVSIFLGENGMGKTTSVKLAGDSIVLTIMKGKKKHSIEK